SPLTQDLLFHSLADVAWLVSAAHSNTGAQVAAVSRVELGDVLSTGYLPFRLPTKHATEHTPPMKRPSPVYADLPLDLQHPQRTAAPRSPPQSTARYCGRADP